MPQPVHSTPPRSSSVSPLSATPVLSSLAHGMLIASTAPSAPTSATTRAPMPAEVNSARCGAVMVVDRNGYPGPPVQPGRPASTLAPAAELTVARVHTWSEALLVGDALQEPGELRALLGIEGGAQIVVVGAGELPHLHEHLPAAVGEVQRVMPPVRRAL